MVRSNLVSSAKISFDTSAVLAFDVTMGNRLRSMYNVATSTSSSKGYKYKHIEMKLYVILRRYTYFNFDLSDLLLLHSSSFNL